MSKKIIIPKNNILSFLQAPKKFNIDDVIDLPVIDKELWDLWINKRKLEAVKLFKLQNDIKNTELVVWYFWGCSVVKCNSKFSLENVEHN